MSYHYHKRQKLDCNQYNKNNINKTMTEESGKSHDCTCPVIGSESCPKEAILQFGILGVLALRQFQDGDWWRWLLPGGWGMVLDLGNKIAGILLCKLALASRKLDL